MADDQSAPTTVYPGKEILPVPASQYTIAMDGSQITVTFFQGAIGGAWGSGQIQARLEPTMAVLLPPVLAKDLHKILGKVLADYERYTKSTIPDMPTAPFAG